MLVGPIVKSQMGTEIFQTSATRDPTSLSSYLSSLLQLDSHGWVCIQRKNGMLRQGCISWDVRFVCLMLAFLKLTLAVIAYQTTLTFWTAAFPGLARNTPQLRAKAEEYTAGTISREAYDYADTLQRSRLSNMAFYIQSCGEFVILAVIVGILFGVHVNDSEANNNYGLSVLIAFGTGVWLLLALPWFVLEKRRPGQSLPPKMNIVMVGFWQLYRAISQIWRLKQSLLYLIGYFLLGDSLNTTVTVISTLQNEVVEYDSLTLTYILMVGIAAQAVGIYSFWWIQQRYKLETKTMFNVVIIGIILQDGWGMIGIWTQRFGYHHVWEFWVNQVYCKLRFPFQTTLPCHPDE